MTVAELMAKLELLWPKKFAGPAGAAWADAYKAAVGHAQGEKLECAWQRFMEGGIAAHAPSPKELAALIPQAQPMPAGEGGSNAMAGLKAKRAQEADEARAWLMTWWEPLLQASAKFPPDLARAIDYEATAACRRRDIAVAMAIREGKQPRLADLGNYAGAMWSARHRNGLKSNWVEASDLPGDALSMWRALVPAAEREAA